VVRPRDAQEAAALLHDGGHAAGGLIARGAGRSYGDAAQNGGGVVLDTSALRWIEGPGGCGGPVRVGAGTTLDELIDHLMARGSTLPVVPGTRHVTVGGAIAADVHGKNHHRDGSFGHHVRSLKLLTPSGQALELSRQVDSELFAATLGGMGLTGVVVEATLDSEPLLSNELSADIDRTDDLEAALAVMAEDQPGHRYAIAWVDALCHSPQIPRRGGLARRGGLGRSVVVRSDYETTSAVGEASAARLSRRSRLAVPRGFPGTILNRTTAKAFNEARWRMAPRQARARSLDMSAHFFPLDAVGHWNRLYGRRGLVQYQFALPIGAEETLLRVMQALWLAGLPMYLVVLKRFGPSSGGLLSFPVQGWTLAIDFPADALGLREALERADALVAGAGGRVYLAKDSRLRAETLVSMYPALERFRTLRAQVDPQGALQSDMARRLGLCGDGDGCT
jgi:decaprenylphospho-beta-D-ribofuranose 2-oxidase